MNHKCKMSLYDSLSCLIWLYGIVIGKCVCMCVYSCIFTVWNPRKWFLILNNSLRFVQIICICKWEHMCAYKSINFSVIIAFSAMCMWVCVCVYKTAYKDIRVCVCGWVVTSQPIECVARSITVWDLMWCVSRLLVWPVVGEEDSAPPWPDHPIFQAGSSLEGLRGSHLWPRQHLEERTGGRTAG